MILLKLKFLWLKFTFLICWCILTTYQIVFGFSILIVRSSRTEVFYKKVLLKISQNWQENTCARVSFFNKVASLSPATLLKKRPWHRCFPDRALWTTASGLPLWNHGSMIFKGSVDCLLATYGKRMLYLFP